jgi:pentatricopeptide repeat protein
MYSEAVMPTSSIQGRIQMNTTKEKECAQAATALVGWFESQEIPGQDAVPIMCMVIGSLVNAMFKAKDHDKAMAAIAKMIREYGA